MDDNRLTKREYDDVFTALMHRGMRSPTTSKVLKLLDPEGRLKSKRSWRAPRGPYQPALSGR